VGNEKWRVTVESVLLVTNVLDFVPSSQQFCHHYLSVVSTAEQPLSLETKRIPSSNQQPMTTPQKRSNVTTKIVLLATTPALDHVVPPR
jgi:hypothetical protein